MKRSNPENATPPPVRSVLETVSHGAMLAGAAFMCAWILFLVCGVLWFKVVLG